MNHPTTRMKVHLAYDGTDYLGWQKQTKQDGKTIQGEFERALQKLTGQTLATTGSGRTDAGVHADDQVVHFDFAGKVESFDWVRGLNRYLSRNIRVSACFQAPEDFHALKSSLSKTYIYSLQDGPVADPLKSLYSHWVSSKLNISYLNSLSECFLGEHDFKSFQTSGTPLATTVRTLTEFKWIRTGPDSVEAHISGTGFLKQMVRNLIGTLLHQYWQESLSQEQIKGILAAQDRTQAFGTAPAHGLRLHRVKYPEELDKKCIKS